MIKPYHPALDKNNPITSGLVFCMPFTEGAGNPLDYVDNPDTAILNNSPVWQFGTNGSEMLFAAASSQFIDLGNPAQLQLTTDFAFCLEYKINTVPPTNKEYQFFTKDDGSTNRAWSIDVAQWGNRGCRFYVNGGGGSGIELDENVNAVAGDSKQLIGWYSTTNNNARFYVNGSQVGNSNSISTPIPNVAINAAIGKRNQVGSEEYLDGVIRYLYVWNRVLTTTEVANLYANPFHFFVTGGLDNYGRHLITRNGMSRSEVAS